MMPVAQESPVDGIDVSMMPSWVVPRFSVMAGSAGRSTSRRRYAFGSVKDQSVLSRVTLFPCETALSPFDDRPKSRTLHGVVGRALPTVLECSTSHLDTVLLRGQFGQLAIDHLPSTVPLAREKASDLRQRESDVAEEENHADVSNR